MAQQPEALSYDTLANTFGARLIDGDHPDYHDARAVWNGLIDHFPEIVVHAESVLEVQHAVNFARNSGLPLAVRGLGHSVAGHCVCNHGLVVDLSRMKGVEIDAEDLTATVQPGVAVGDFLDLIEANGMMMTVGSHSGVGLVGLTLGGGVGLLMSRYGLASDNLLSAEIVTADGEVRIANKNENSDLFWAIRGGGGNFGIAVSLTFRLHRVEPMILGVLVHPLPRFREVLGVFREHAEKAPDNLGIFAAAVTDPGGHPAANLMLCFTGSQTEADHVIGPIRAFGSPVVDMVSPAPYGRIMHALDGLDPSGHHYQFHCRGIVDLTDELLDIIADFAQRRTSLDTAIVVYRQNGAVANLPQDATAYPSRGLPYLLGIYVGWDDGDGGKHIEWLSAFKNAVAPLTVVPGFVSFLGKETADGCAKTTA